MFKKRPHQPHISPLNPDENKVVVGKFKDPRSLGHLSRKLVTFLMQKWYWEITPLILVLVVFVGVSVYSTFHFVLPHILGESNTPKSSSSQVGNSGTSGSSGSSGGSTSHSSGGSTPGSKTSNPSTSPGGSSPTGSTPPPPVNLVQPAIPGSAAYLGAWVLPNQTSGDCGSDCSDPGGNEIASLPAFNSQIGKSVSILTVYTPFNDPVPSTTLAAIEANGSTPMINWGCNSTATLSDVVSGQLDNQINYYAQTLKSFAKPVFLRWYWEMNISSPANQPCGGYGNGSTYIAAWQHIWTIFHTVGANNVAFVWCPSHSDPAGSVAYYPGSSYVNWIAADGYDESNLGSSGFSTIFSGFYQQWAGAGKPMMVGETGAESDDQAGYISGLEQTVPQSFPDFKAILYFDSNAGNDYSLTNSGAAAFKNLADSPYFSYTGS